MAHELVTRAGLVPAVNEVPYSITTEMAAEFLQQQLDSIVTAMNKGIRVERERKKSKKNKEHRLELKIPGMNDDDLNEDFEFDEDDNEPEFQEDVSLTLITTKMSKKFFPFYIFLPTSILVNSSKLKKNESSIFTPDNDSTTAKLKNEFFNWIKPLLYPRKEVDAFFAPTVRNSMELTLKKCHEIKFSATPKIQRWNNGKEEYVVAILDPIRVFHYMLENAKEHDSFQILIDSNHIEPIRRGNYRYDVSRVKNKNGKNKKNRNMSSREQLAYELSRKFNN